MPTLDFAFLADAAEAHPGRKFYVLGGGIEGISGQDFPLTHGHMALVMRFLLHPSELGHAHEFEVRTVDADGRELLKVEGNIATEATDAAVHEVGVNVVLNIENARFEQPGDYAIDIVINKQFQKSLPLHVTRA